MKLKLNVNKPPAEAAPAVTAATPATPGGLTPGGFKARIKLNTSAPPTPVEAGQSSVKKTKSGRAPKPSAKIVQANLKRSKDDSDTENEQSTINVAARERPSKKLKLNFGGPKTPVVLKAKLKGKPPKRPLGEGYDSEASDREIDPTIEEEFVLRMMPGEDCDYLRDAIKNKKIGEPRKDGGADVYMKFFHPEGRRAAITIRGHPYAATLVDLPCVIEGMKSWDKRGWWKSADICQMLLVFAPISKEEEAKTIPLPKIIDSETHQYPHGLTPPMHYARKRRFRKRISKNTIEAVEDAVEKLLAADAESESSRWEMVDPDGGSRRSSQYSPGASSPGEYDVGKDVYSEDEDAEGEVDDSGYFGHVNANGVPDGMNHNLVDDLAADLEADLEAAMQADFEAGTPMSSAIEGAATPSIMNGETPATPVNGEEGSGEDSFDSGEDEEDDDDAGVDEIDEDEKARLAQLQGAREDIVDLEKQLASVQAQLAIQANPILRKRLEDNARKLKAELQLKKSAVGEAEDD